MQRTIVCAGMAPPLARSVLLVASLAACSRPGRIEPGRETDAAVDAHVPDVPQPDASLPPEAPPDGTEIAPAPFACTLRSSAGARCNLCGDGRIEDCSSMVYAGTAPAADPARPPPPLEFCDGAPLPGVSCQSLGFLGGELRCADTCMGHDTSACISCGSDPAIHGCRPSVLPGAVNSIAGLALATTDTQIALAWSVYDTNNASYMVGVRRFAPDLSPIEGTGCVALRMTGGSRLALAGTRAGFLLAGEQYTSARVMPLNPDGTLRGPGRELTQAAGPRLAVRPEGGQAVAWLDRVRMDAALVQVIDAEGAELAPPVQIPAEWMTGELSLLAVNDGFLAATVEPGQGVFLLKLGLDGKPVARNLVAGARAPRLVGDGTGAKLLYTVSGARTLVPIDATGAPMSASAVTLAAGDPLGAIAVPVVLGWKGEVLELGDVEETGTAVASVTLAHRRPMGVPGAAPIRVSLQPRFIRGVALGRRGDEVVAAWIAIEEMGGAFRTQNARIGLARLVP